MVARELHELSPRGNGIGDHHLSRLVLGVLVADGIGELIAQLDARPLRILSVALGLLGHVVGRGAGIALVANRNGGGVVDGADSALSTLHGVLGNLDAHAYRAVAARRLHAQVPSERLATRGALIGVLALKGLEHNADGQLIGHGHAGIGLGVNPVDGVDVGVAHREQLPVDVHTGLRDRADCLDLIARVVEDDLAVLGAIAIDHLGRKRTVVVIGHLEQHAARRGRVHGTHALGQVDQALFCHQVKAIGSGVVGIVPLDGNAIVDGAGKVNRLLMSFAGSIAELKVKLTEVDRCDTVIARLGRALVPPLERTVGLLSIQVKRILVSLDLVAGIHHLLGSKALKRSGRGIAVGKGHFGLGGTVLGAIGLHIASSFDSVGVIVLDGSLGIERTVTAVVNRNLYRPIGRIVGVTALLAAILDHLVGERLVHITRRKGQTAQNTGMRRAIGLRFIVRDGELTLIRAQQRLELFG